MMIKSLTATTREIDDIDAAVKEITSALNIGVNLLSNSLGIISCFSEFAETGALKAICDVMPFDCIGATTIMCSAENETDQVLLTITVLTSDECSFETIALPVTEDYMNSIGTDLKNLLNRREEKPALLLSYFPMLTTVSGDMILTALDEATSAMPLFGTMAIDHTTDYSTACTICNGEAYKDAVVLGLIYGTVDYSFEIASLDDEKIGKQEAIITESSGNILISVNGKPALEYLNEIGITRNDLETGLGILPLVVDYKDGTKPVARAVFALTPDGHTVCGGAMPVGATLAAGRIVMDDVLQTTEKAIKEIAVKDGAILSYSCLARYLALGVNSEAEAEKVSELTESSHYMFAISGGEVCPLPDADGKLKNLFHNYTNVFCRIC